MIFEALLLLLRADNRPGNGYVLWRKLQACAFFVFWEDIMLDNKDSLYSFLKSNAIITSEKFLLSLLSLCEFEANTPDRFNIVYTADILHLFTQVAYVLL